MRGCEGDEVAIVLAAGRGVRMGGPKALMMVGGRPWWRVQRERLRAAGVRDVWVVSREVRDSMGREDSPERVVIGDADAAMFASVVAGVVALRDDSLRGVFLLPVDVPAPSVGVWKALRGADSPSVPTCGGRRGHPVWLPWSFVERAILPCAEDRVWVARTRLDRLVADEVVEVAVEDAGVLVNLNTSVDVERWEKDRGCPGLAGFAARPGDGADAARPD